VGNGPIDRNASGNNLSNKVLQAIFVSTTSFTITPGTGGGSAFTITPPYLLALMTTAGTDTGNGTEATTVNCPGYTTLAGGSAKSVTFSITTSALSSSNAQSYTASGSWSTIVGVEIWDSAATKLRYLQSGNSSFTSITGVASGDTVSFASAAITYDGTAW
jgi:hypothetical protein